METSKNIYLGDCGIGAVKTDSQVGGKEHGAKRIAFAPARAAFLGLMRVNLWGMASVLAQTAFEVDKATTDSQSAPNYWWDVGARWRNGWYNLGGSWSSFVKAVLKGKNRKPFLVAVAPRDADGNITTAGYGTIGVSVLALLYLGTRKKGKKLF